MQMIQNTICEMEMKQNTICEMEMKQNTICEMQMKRNGDASNNNRFVENATSSTGCAAQTTLEKPDLHTFQLTEPEV